MLNNMKVLIGLLILIAGLAYWVTQTENNTVTAHQPLIPAWQQDDGQINAIDQVVLSQGAEQLVLTKTADGWLLNDGFYASIEPLFNLIQSLKTAEIKELKTANPDSHAQLDLADDDLQVSIYQGGALQQAFHVGKKSTAGLTFVRRVGEDQTYTVQGLEPISFNADNWALKTVLDIPADEINAVTLQPAEGDVISVNRDLETGQLQLTVMPEGFQLKDNAYLDQLASGLTRLMIDDALPADSWPPAIDNEAEEPVKISISYQLSAGQSIEMDVYAHGEDYFLTIDSGLFPQYADWVMKIAAYKFKALNRQLTEFIEPVAAQDSPADEAVDESSGD